MDRNTNLNALAEKCHRNACDKGFWSNENSDRSTAELLMLIVSELSEALEADRKGDHCTMINDKDKANLQRIQFKEEYAVRFRESIKDTFQDEIADTIIRILDLCHAFNIDIDFHVRAKMRYNEWRERMHGKRY